MKKFIGLVLIIVSLISTTGCTTAFSSPHDRAVDMNEQALANSDSSVNNIVIVSYRYDTEINQGVTDMAKRGYEVKKYREQCELWKNYCSI